MKIAVFGTSNSILKNGYVSGLRFSPHVDVARQFCLGHSTSVALPYTTKGVDFDAYDFCLVDFVVNEETFEKFPESLTEIRRRLDFLISLLADKKCIPVAMIMPVEVRIGTPLPVYQLYLDYFRAHNFPVFDGYAALARLMNGSVKPLASYFRDPSHLAPWAATALGLALGEQLAAFRDRVLDRRISRTQGHAFGYVPLRPQEGATIETRDRKSSLSAESFQRIGPGDRLVANVAGAEAISGVGLNLGQTNWPLVVRSGENRGPAFFGKEYFDPTEARYLFVIRTIPELAVDGDEAWVLPRRVPAAPENAPRPKRPSIVAEVHGLTVRYPQTELASCSLILRGEQAADLVAPISDTFFRATAMTALRLSA